MVTAFSGIERRLARCYDLRDRKDSVLNRFLDCFLACLRCRYGCSAAASTQWSNKA